MSDTYALFKMGGVDYTQYITVPSYKVNKQPVYNEYTDCDYKTHKEKARDQISGTFTLYFQSIDELKSFLDSIHNNTQTDGSVLCTVYLVNYMTTADCYLYFEYDPSDTLPYFGAKDYDGFDVTITER